MVKSILYILIFYSFLSCNSKRVSCNYINNQLELNLLFKSIDTNCIYIKKKIINVNDENSKFIENENNLIKEKMPCFRFTYKGKIEFYYDLTSYEKFKKPIIGSYRFYNDTIEVCREYYSVQSGKYIESSVFIIKDSTIEEKKFPIDNGITTIYEKKISNR